MILDMAWHQSTHPDASLKMFAEQRSGRGVVGEQGCSVARSESQLRSPALAGARPHLGRLTRTARGSSASTNHPPTFGCSRLDSD
nr:hypothetical protein CFP56_03044 [Quercus suber]